MINKILTILFFISNISVIAQDKLAGDILDRLQSTRESYQNITIEFDFTFENENIMHKNSGILFMENENFQLEIGNQIIINNGETQWIYLSDINEVQIMNYDVEDEIIHPNKLFNLYKQDYKYVYVGTKSENSKKLHIIDLFPNNSGLFMKIQLIIEESKNEPHSMILFDKNGGTYSYNINSFNGDNKMPTFIFNSINYPNVEIVDLR